MITFLNNKKNNYPLASYRPLLRYALVITLVTVACNTQFIRQSSAADDADQSGDNVASNEKKRVCRNDLERTGTHFKTRICKTQAEWDAIDHAERRGAEEYTRRSNDRSSGVSGTGSGGDAYMGGGTSATSQ